MTVWCVSWQGEGEDSARTSQNASSELNLSLRKALSSFVNLRGKKFLGIRQCTIRLFVEYGSPNILGQ